MGVNRRVLLVFIVPSLMENTFKGEREGMAIHV